MIIVWWLWALYDLWFFIANYLSVANDRIFALYCHCIVILGLNCWIWQLSFFACYCMFMMICVNPSWPVVVEMSLQSILYLLIFILFRWAFASCISSTSTLVVCSELWWAPCLFSVIYCACFICIFLICKKRHWVSKYAISLETAPKSNIRCIYYVVWLSPKFDWNPWPDFYARPLTRR